MSYTINNTRVNYTIPMRLNLLNTLSLLLVLFFFPNITQAETYECQASDPEGGYLDYLNDFAEEISDLTDGEVEFEFVEAGALVPVSYTHLTLPTICSV